jgi:2-polyprenyl-3-methyl-5-hydroxy-6-metoxy-1,4-benzoquinol methylase
MTVAGHRLRRCGGCRSLWVESPPPPEATEAMYRDARYFSSHEAGAPAAGGGMAPGYSGDYLRDRPHVEAKFAAVLEHVERYVAPGRLLDVGCGPGFLLSAARARGWDVRGIDLNPWAAAHARDELGLDVTRASLEEAGFDDAGFDAITMMDLVEHVPDPDALVREAARIVRPGGMLVILTPDAGAPVSRALGARWPEVQRAGEHLVLLSRAGATSVLERNGCEPVGWHYVGKTASLETLLDDVAPAAPLAARLAAPAVRGTALGRAELELDPHTKFVLYARRAGGDADAARGPRRAGGDAAPGLRRAGADPVHGARRAGDGPGAAQRPPPVRLPKRVPRGRPTEEAVLEELRALARARRLCDWMFEQFAPHVRGRMVEIGAGIGTFSERALAAGAERLLLVEPEEGCAGELERRFGGDARVEIARELLPDSPALKAIAGQADFVLCQNVLEHIEDDRAAAAAMAAALRPGGHLTLLVPALPRLFGTLDLAYGHWRRYTPGSLRAVVESAGLEVVDLHWFNALGIPGWWLKNRRASTGIGPLALRAYDAAVVPWRALERRVRPPAGLSLIVHARRP